MRALLICALAGILPYSASADENVSPNDWKIDAVGRVEACRHSGVIGNEIKHECIGLIAAACPGIAGSTSSMVGCFEDERVYWESEMAAPIQSLKDYYANGPSRPDSSYEVAPLLDAYQQDWETWRRKKCEFAVRFEGPGSSARIVEALCEMRATAENVLELEMLGQLYIRK